MSRRVASGRRRVALPCALAASLVAVGAVARAEGAAGSELYEQSCASCHGPRGQGDGPAGIGVVPAPRDFTVGEFKFDADSDGTPGTDADLALVIRDGALAYGGNPLMAAWGHLGEESIRGLVGYIRSFERTR